MSQTKRFELTWPLVVRLGQRLGWRSRSKQKEEAVEEETITTNISTTDCYFYVSKKPKLGSKAEMEITVPGSSVGLGNGTVSCRGKVVRVDAANQDGKVGVACSIDSYVFRPSKRKSGGS